MPTLIVLLAQLERLEYRHLRDSRLPLVALAEFQTSSTD